MRVHRRCPQVLLRTRDPGSLPDRWIERHVGGRTDAKLELAKRHGADHVINTRDRSLESVRAELERLTGSPELDAVIDCVGAKGTLQLGFGLLATEGASASVGLVGDRIDIPLFPFVAREYSYFGSFWGNCSDISEVLELAERGAVKHAVERIAFKDVNDALNRLGRGEILGRAVIVHD